MPITNLYSRRKKDAERTEPDVYTFDVLPGVLRIQIEHILIDAIGERDDVWDYVRNTLCREHGCRWLSDRNLKSPDDCLDYLSNHGDVDGVLDLIELAFSIVDTFVREFSEDSRRRHRIKQEPDDAIDELNNRFRQASVGYQFVDGQIIRIDSQLVHAEVVRPALQLLSDNRFKGAEEEFRSAHAHYRAGEHKDAVADALNAFESTLKVICDAKHWKYPKGARATDLIKVVRSNGLLPDYLDNSFDQLAATLQSGLPKVRNEAGGHGQGGTPKETPAHIAAYALHLAAAKIVLLVEAFKASDQ